MSAPDFSTKQVDLAIQHVIENCAWNRGQTTYYSSVFAAADLAAPQELHNGGNSHIVTAFMKAFHDRCNERDLPPLDALVVHVAGPRASRPGAGYFTVNGLVDPFREPPPAIEQQVRAAREWDRQKAVCRTWGVENRRLHGRSG